MVKKTEHPRHLLLGQVLQRADFWSATIVGVLMLATAYYWLLLRVSTLDTTIGNVSQEPAYFAAIKILVPLTLVLFGLNFALGILLFRAGGGLPAGRQGFRWQGGSFLGALTGGFAAACPVCGAFLLSLVGVTAGLTALPFAGLEIWTASSAVMAFTFFGSLRTLDKNTCEPKLGTVCWQLPKVNPRHLVILFFLGFGLFANFYSLLLSNEPGLRAKTAKFLQKTTGFEMNVQRKLGVTSQTGNALFDEVKSQVLPEEGVTLPIRWGAWLLKLVETGVIDLAKFEQSFTGNGGLTEEQKRLLTQGSDEFITITNDNSWFTVMAFWPLGLANKTEINRQSPIAGESLFNFASTGGWSLGEEENGGTYFNKYELVGLTPEQEELVQVLAESSYRPCCNNSTFFQDCNHGSALLGLLELGASQGLSRQELAQAALVANSFWFPHNYLQAALYLKVVKGIDWEEANPEEVLGFEFSSGGGAAQIAQEVQARNLLPEGAGGAQCGV